jgi:hypothetical protein
VLVGCLIQRTQELEGDLDRLDPLGSRDREEDILLCIDKASSALASLLLHLPTHEGMHGIAGLEAVVSICKVSRHGRVLRALAQVIAAMVPSPQYRKVIYDLFFIHSASSDCCCTALLYFVIFCSIAVQSFFRMGAFQMQYNTVQCNT